MVQAVRVFIVFAEILLLVILICTWACFSYNLVNEEVEDKIDCQYETISMAIVSSIVFLLILFPMILYEENAFFDVLFNLAIFYAGITLIVAGSFIVNKLEGTYEGMVKGEKFSYACGLSALVFGVALLIGSIFFIFLAPKLQKKQNLRKPQQEIVRESKPAVNNQSKRSLMEVLGHEEAKEVLRHESNGNEHKVHSHPKRPLMEVLGKEEESGYTINDQSIESPIEVLDMINNLIQPEIVDEETNFITITPCTSMIRMDDLASPRKSLRKLSALSK
jgi:hypothetical protein